MSGICSAFPEALVAVGVTAFRIEDRWEAQAKDEFGDLGPGEAARAGAPGGGGGPRRRRRR